MAYDDLQDFLAALEARGELRRIKAEVDPELEITEIADRVMRAGGPALLFERVRGSRWPLVINAMGSEARMALAFGAESLDAKAAEIEGHIAWLWKQLRGFSLLSAVPEALPRLPAALSLLPKRVARPICREVIAEDEGFDSLPVLRCWPGDGGRFLTLPVVCTRDPDTGAQNMGMYRMQVYDDRTAGMHWH
ncbi:MAG TPA: UbiD family decarboxylase, partial [Spirochaetia bacterium]|nr:UbiD family decarboxylase [Spirochaetia bacterium]